MAVFQTLGQLGDWYNRNPQVDLVDPGMPLTEWNADASYGPAWKNQPSIRKVVGFCARNIASTPLHVYERRTEQDRVRVREGELAKLLARPSRSPGVTPYRFWESLLIDGLLFDKWCARIVEHEDGYELVRIPARLVSFTNDGLDRIDQVVLTSKDGQKKEFDPSEFVLDVGYADRGCNGTSPLETLRQLLDEYRESVEYRRSVWKNGARVPGLITRDKPWPSDTSRERFAKSWREFSRDGGRSGGTPVLEDGMKYEKVEAFKPQDTQDLEGRRLTDIEVASAYHIPPELVGAREGTFSNIQAFKQMLYGPALGPYIDAWQQQLNASLVPLLVPGKDIYVEANIESKLRGSFEEQTKVMSTAAGGPYMTRNEVRSRLNLSSVDGGDELIVPLNVLIGGQASPQDGGDGRPPEEDS